MSFSSFEENWKHGSKVNSSRDRARVKFGNFIMVKAEYKSEVSNFSMVKVEGLARKIPHKTDAVTKRGTATCAHKNDEDKKWF